jgi:hypothetical protein
MARESRQSRHLHKSSLAESVNPSQTRKAEKQKLATENGNTFSLIASEWLEIKRTS